MSALKRLAFAEGRIIDITEPTLDVQFAGWELDWFHRIGNGWCCCLDPRTTRDAEALLQAQRQTDRELLVYLQAKIQEDVSHRGFPWSDHMLDIKSRLEFARDHIRTGDARRAGQP